MLLLLFVNLNVINIMFEYGVSYPFSAQFATKAAKFRSTKQKVYNFN